MQELEPGRGYVEIMDQHALHIFFVRMGRVVEESPEFESFKRVHVSIWGKVTNYLAHLEIYCKLLKIKMLRVNGSKLVQKIWRSMPPTAENLIDCVLPYGEEASEVDPSSYDGTEFHHKLRLNALVKIQSLFRMRKARIRARKLRILLRKIKFIQSWIRVYLAKSRTRRQVLSSNEQKYLDFDALQSKLKEDWEFIKGAGRVEIHYNSLGGTEIEKLSMSKFEQRQNIQIGRIFRVLERGIDVVYISSTFIPQDIIRYYNKVLQLIGIPAPHRRVHFLVPSKCEEFPPHISIASKILYSRDTIKKIRDIVNGRYAVLVGGVPSNDDIKLAVYLGYPILSGNPLKNSIAMNQYQTKEVRKIKNLKKN